MNMLATYDITLDNLDRILMFDFYVVRGNLVAVTPSHVHLLILQIYYPLHGVNFNDSSNLVLDKQMFDYANTFDTIESEYWVFKF